MRLLRDNCDWHTATLSIGELLNLLDSKCFAGETIPSEIVSTLLYLTERIHNTVARANGGHPIFHRSYPHWPIVDETEICILRFSYATSLKR